MSAMLRTGSSGLFTLQIERNTDRSPESKQTMETTGSRVSRSQIERLWTLVGDDTSDPHAGIFGPSSVSWKVNRESALFVGAGRAALLQLAHPWVAAALHQPSNLRTDPLARFHNTFRVAFTMIFGTLEQALAAYQLHTRIQGKLPESAAAYPQGASYEANEVNALLLVYARAAFWLDDRCTHVAMSTFGDALVLLGSDLSRSATSRPHSASSPGASRAPTC